MDSEYYTADSSLEKYIKQWKNGFKYLESGTRYVQKISKIQGKNKTELIELYPYWTISIVTSDSEVDKLRDKILKNLSDFSHPIIIISETEARNKIQGEKALDESKILFPLAWSTNIDQNYFATWKNEIIIKAKETKNLREIKEKELGDCTELLKSTREFYDKYSYEYYTEICKNQRDLKGKIEDVLEKLKRSENRLIEVEIEIARLDKDNSEFLSEQKSLELKVVKGDECLNKISEKEENEIEVKSIANKIEEIQDDLGRFERRLKENKDIEKEIEYDFNFKKGEFITLKSEKLYEEVKAVTPIYSDSSKEVLEEQRKNLKDALNNKQKDRRLFEEKLKNAENNKIAYEKFLGDFIKKLEIDVEENLEFPLSGEVEINKLLHELQELKEPIKKLKDQLEIEKAKFENSKTIYHIRKKDYFNFYARGLNPPSLDGISF